MGARQTARVTAALCLTPIAVAGLHSSHASAAAGAKQCSRAAAKSVIREHPRLHPFAPTFTAPGPVLCGPFLGRRSNAMIVSFQAATCGGTFGWAAFRRHRGRWNLVWRYGNGQRSIAKVGQEIRETVNILRPGDPRCLPTGGTKSRRWRWNGHKFVAGRWTYVNPESFASPDRHVTCYISRAETSCHAMNPSGPQYSARLSRAGAVSTCAAAIPSLKEHCFQQWDNELPTLRYGQRTTVEGFRCTSTREGIMCTRASAPGQGHGFNVNRYEAVALGG